MGDVVNVKDGFARNYLLPQKKALRATKDNLSQFEGQRAQLEANNLEQKKEAEAVAAKLEGKTFVAIRSAGDTGQLYGSVSTRDIAEVVTEGGFTVDRRQVIMDKPIKTLGLHETRIALHPEVVVTVIAQRRALAGRSREAGPRRGRHRCIKDEKLELETFNPDERVRGRRGARRGSAEGEEA